MFFFLVQVFKKMTKKKGVLSQYDVVFCSKKNFLLLKMAVYRVYSISSRNSSCVILRGWGWGRGFFS